MRKSYRRLAVILAMILILIPLMSPVLAVPSEPEEQLELLREIETLIQDHYLGGTDVYELPEDLGAEDFDETQNFFYEEITKLIKSLDEYSGFYPADVMNVYFGESESLVGIGVVVDANRPLGAYIIRVVPGGAAEAAGLKADDQIVSVDGADVRFVPMEEIVPLLRGMEDTPVTVGVRRPGALEDVYFTLVRKPISVSNVAGRTLGDTIGYISILGFDDHADVEAFAQLMERFGTLGMKDLIIDLRGNGGGVVEIMSGILNILPGTADETLFTMSNDNEIEVFTHIPQEAWVPGRILVMVDEYTASASEVMAGSLMDRGIAETVGTQTFGKSRAQWVWELFSGDVLAVTTYVIELPVTGDYQSVGLTPDYEAEFQFETLDVTELVPLNPMQAILPGLSAPSRVKALEQRLWLMGYFLTEPDEVFDAYTLHALQGFQHTEELTVTNYASVQTLTRLEEYMAEFDGYDYVLEDTQLAFALGVLGE